MDNEIALISATLTSPFVKIPNVMAWDTVRPVVKAIPIFSRLPALRLHLRRKFKSIFASVQPRAVIPMRYEATVAIFYFVVPGQVTTI